MQDLFRLRRWHTTAVVLCVVMGLLMAGMSVMAAPAQGEPVAFTHNGGNQNQDCPNGMILLGKFNRRSGSSNSYSEIVNTAGINLTGENRYGGNWSSTSPISRVRVVGTYGGSNTTNHNPAVTSGSFNNSGLVDGPGQGNRRYVEEVIFCGQEATASITIFKQVSDEIYDRAFDFTFTSGNTVTPFSISDTGVGGSDSVRVFDGLTSGSYSIAEVLGNLPANWTYNGATCATTPSFPPNRRDIVAFDFIDGSLRVSLGAGQDIFCHFVNTYTPPPTGSITIIKNVVGDDFSDEVFDFTFNGNTPFQISENGTPFVAGELVAGTYNITETVPANWDLTSINCGVNQNNTAAVNGVNVVLEAGETVTCTFNNLPPEPELGTLRVVKQVPVSQAETAPNFEFSSSIFNPDPQSLSIGINGFGATGQYVVEIDTYTVEEVNIPNGWYLVSIDCGDAPFVVNGASVDVTVGADEDVICTFFNEQRANIIIEKDVTEGDEDQVFDFVYNDGSDFNFPLSETGGEDGLFDALIPGDYTITEENLPEGWTLDDVVCESTGDNSTFSYIEGGVTVSAASGEDVTCTFENSYDDPMGSLMLIKTIPVDQVPSTPFFDWESTFAPFDNLSMQPTGTGSVGTPPLDAAPGTYTIEEVFIPNGWYLGSIDCGDATVAEPFELGDTAVSVTVGDGEDVVCTFYNEQRANIIIEKDVTEGDEDQVFDFVFEDFEFPLSETGGEDGLFDALIPGDYTITEENLPEGWTLDNVVCESTGDNSTFSYIEGGVTVSAASGEDVTCTFENSQEEPELGIIKVFKYYDVNDDGSWFFEPPLYGFEFVVYDELGNQVAPSQVTGLLGFAGFVLEAGNYTVCELLPEGWTNTQPATINEAYDQPCQDVELGQNDFELISFGNREIEDGSIRVTKYEDVNNNGSRQNDSEPRLSGWSIMIFDSNGDQVGITRQTASNGRRTFNNLAPGTYTVCEVQQEGWVNTQNGNANIGTINGNLICHEVEVEEGLRTDTIFGNYQLPTTADVTLVKLIDWNGNDVNNAVSFQLCLDDLCGIANFGNGYTVVLEDVLLGSYTLSEAPAANWTVSFPGGTSAEVTLDGENTFYVRNTADAPPPPPPVEQVGTIRVTKNVVTPPAEYGDFTICISNAVFPEDQQNQPACYLVHNNGDQVSWNVVIPENQNGVNVTISENNPGANWSVSGSGASVTVYPDQTSYHTITNTYNAPPPPSCEGGMGSQSHLSGVITISGSTAYGTVYNNSDVEDCQYQIGMASYSKYDDIIDNQVLFAGFDTIVMIPAGGSVELSIALPECAVQVDLFYGTLLPNLNGQRYGSRLLAYVHHGGNYCEAPQQEQPPVEEQQPPVEEQQPPVEEQQPPVEEQQPPVEEQQPPVEEQQPPAEEQQQP